MRIKNLAALAAVVLLAAGLAFIIYFRLGESAPREEITAARTEAPAVTASPPATPSATPSATPVPTVLEPEPEPDYPDIDITSWEYRLVNTERLLESDYAPELTAIEGGHSFDSRAAQRLLDFLGAAREAGNSAVLISTYRPYSTQETLFNNKVAQQQWNGLDLAAAQAAAARIVARPGTSEHQLGLAADITDKVYDYMNESLADTQLSIWMKENCADFGFILRYPKEKQDITKIMFEPWHFRYVGEAAARYIMDNGICLEEFVALYE